MVLIQFMCLFILSVYLNIFQIVYFKSLLLKDIIKIEYYNYLRDFRNLLTLCYDYEVLT